MQSFDVPGLFTIRDVCVQGEYYAAFEVLPHHLGIWMVRMEDVNLHLRVQPDNKPDTWVVEYPDISKVWPPAWALQQLTGDFKHSHLLPTRRDQALRVKLISAFPYDGWLDRDAHQYIAKRVMTEPPSTESDTFCFNRFRFVEYTGSVVVEVALGWTFTHVVRMGCKVWDFFSECRFFMISGFPCVCGSAKMFLCSDQPNSSEEHYLCQEMPRKDQPLKKCLWFKLSAMIADVCFDKSSLGKLFLARIEHLNGDKMDVRKSNLRVTYTGERTPYEPGEFRIAMTSEYVRVMYRTATAAKSQEKKFSGIHCRNAEEQMEELWLSKILPFLKENALKPHSQSCLVLCHE